MACSYVENDVVALAGLGEVLAGVADDVVRAKGPDHLRDSPAIRRLRTVVASSRHSRRVP